MHQTVLLHKYLPVQLFPLPWYPLTQRQTYDPLVLVHTALESHSFVSGLAHSSTSAIGVKILELNFNFIINNNNNKFNIYIAQIPCEYDQMRVTKKILKAG